MEDNMLREENNKLTQALENKEKELGRTKKKLTMSLELIKGISYLIPKAIIDFNDELERIDGKDQQPRQNTPQEGTREEKTEG
tara:strand:- start:1394 stop:1642 length:249 start_codon:yes stop_codon:yes gene_type:complete